MSNNVRSMTPKRFVSYKLSGKVSAEGFLSAHWDFLLGQSYLSPILEAYENKEVLPTPTVQMCQAAVLSHILECQTQKGVSFPKSNKDKATKVIRRKESGEVEESEAPNARYQVTLFCKFYSRDGICTVDVGDHKGEKTIFDADTYQDASRIADRKLSQREDAVYAVIVNTHDRPIETRVMRDDAIARMYAAPKGPSTRNTSSGGSNLGFGIKAKNDISHFSRG